MSSSLVKIVNKRLTLSGSIRIPENDNIRIISILGKARMGKSTFLNAIVHWLQGTQGTFTPPFATQDDDNHCTRGIDYYYSKSKSILLLDCQGLALEDSSHDPMLLLFTYLISDRIIFNERMMLQNEALKLMEPICAFMNYIETEDFEKPKLFFRISDSNNMSTDAKINLAKVMAQYNDQYQSIRDSVAHLFQPEIGIIKTDILDRKTKVAVQNGSYTELFEEESLGFTKAVETLFADLPKGRPAKIWLKDVPKYVDDINNNKKITIDKLDVVTLNATNEMLEWEKTIPADNFSPIVADGLQVTYDIKVEPRKKAKKELLSKFTRSFKALPDSIKEKRYNELNERLMDPIAKADAAFIDLAEAGLAHLVRNAQSDRDFVLDNTTHPYTRFDKSWISNYFSQLDTLRSAMERYVEPVRTKYETWMKNQVAKFNVALEKCEQNEALQLARMKRMCDDIEESYLEDAETMIAEMERIDYQGRQAVGMVTIPTPWIVNHIQEKAKEKAQLAVYFVPHRISVSFRNSTLTATVTTMPEVKAQPTHELFRSTWEAFNTAIAKKAQGDNNGLHEAVLARKETILQNKWFTFGDCQQIPHTIPEIQFVLIDNFGPFTNFARVMSLKTYQNTYHHMMLNAVNVLEKEGALRGMEDIVVQLDQHGPANLKKVRLEYAEDFLAPLFHQAFATVCACKRVKDITFPQKAALSTVV